MKYCFLILGTIIFLQLFSINNSLAQLTASSSRTDALCFGQSNGTITVTATGGSEPYEYSKNGGSNYQSSNIFTGLIANTYSIRVKDQIGNTFDLLETILNPELLEIGGTFQSVTGCFGNTNAFIHLTATGGKTPYQFSINSGTTWYTNGDFNNLGIGTYFAKVKDANDCISSTTVVITQPTNLTFTKTEQNEYPCKESNNGRITINATGGNTPYEYSIDGLHYQSSNIFTSLNASVFTVYVRDSKFCLKTTTATITEPPLLQIDSVGKTDLVCSGQNTGQIRIFARGGIPNITYSVNGTSFSSNNIFNNLASGSYQAIAMDQNGCQKSQSITIASPAAIVVDSFQNKNIQCAGMVDGYIKIYAHGGTSPLSYSLNGIDNFQPNGIFLNLSANNYPLTIKDSRSCTLVSNQSIYEPSALQVSTTVIDATCFGTANGGVVLSAAYGTQPYRYSIDGGTNYTKSGEFNSLIASNYNYKILDTMNCSLTGSFVIASPAKINFNPIIINDIQCYGQTSGSINITAQGGQSPYLYSKNAGINYQTSGLFSNLDANFYLLKIKDFYQCIVDTLVEISEPSINISHSKQNITCFGAHNGSINLNVSGDNSPFEISFNGSAYSTQTNYTNLLKGVYPITIKDAQNCTIEMIDTIEEPALLYIDSLIVNEGCFNQNNAKITVDKRGGTSPFVYSIDYGANYVNDSIFTDLSIGTYQIKILDAYNCSATKSTIIGNTSIMKLDSIPLVHLKCANESNGKISIYGKGGIPPYSYSIDGGLTKQSGNIFENLVPKSYSIIFYDKNLCQLSTTKTLNSPAGIVLNVNKTDISTCYGLLEGGIQMIASGGTGTLLYSINGTNYFVNSNFSGLRAGLYQVYVKDFNQCNVTSQVSISEPFPIEILGIESTNLSGCRGLNNGTIFVQATGGTAPLRYSLDGGITYQANAVFTNLGKGIYEIAVSDQNGCAAALGKDTLLESNPIRFDIEIENISCFARNDGRITVNAYGGSGDYEYSIDGGNQYLYNAGLFTNLAKKDYIVLVRDNTDCVSSPLPVKISEPLQLKIDRVEVSGVTCASLDNGTAKIVASGGTPPLTYMIDRLDPIYTSSFANLEDGLHQAFINDSNACTATMNFNIKSSDDVCVEIPDAFSPNGDGINDEWKINHIELYDNASVQVFDREGIIVHVFRNGGKTWDGTFNGKTLPVGTYWYIVDLNNKTSRITGNVTLLR